MKHIFYITLFVASGIFSIHAASSTSLDTNENLNCAWVAEQMGWPLEDDAIIFAMKDAQRGPIFTDLRAKGVSTNILRELHDDMANHYDSSSLMGLAAVVETAAQRNKIKAEALASADVALKDALAGLQQRAAAKEQQLIEKGDRAGIGGAVCMGVGLGLMLPLMVGGLVLGGVSAPLSIPSIIGATMYVGAYVQGLAIPLGGGLPLFFKADKYKKKIAALKLQASVKSDEVAYFNRNFENIAALQ